MKRFVIIQRDRKGNIIIDRICAESSAVAKVLAMDNAKLNALRVKTIKEVQNNALQYSEH